MLYQAKQNYYSCKITEYEKDQKRLFTITKGLMGDSNKKILPSCTCPQDLAEKFSDYFTNKITTIRHKITDQNPPAHDVRSEPVFEGVPLSHFGEATENEIKKLIAKSPCKSCDLEPLPT